MHVQTFLLWLFFGFWCFSFNYVKVGALTDVEYDKLAYHRSKMNTCEAPKENLAIFHSCTADKFPGSKTKCSCTNNCGKKVKLNCYKGKWQKARGLFRRKCSETFTSKLVKCVQGKNKPTCRCKSNCFNLNKKCATIKSWEIKTKCEKTTEITLRDGPKHIIQAFHDGAWHYYCDKGYTLVGEKSRTCNDGVLSGEKPKCEKEKIENIKKNKTSSKNSQSDDDD